MATVGRPRAHASVTSSPEKQMLHPLPPVSPHVIVVVRRARETLLVNATVNLFLRMERFLSSKCCYAQRCQPGITAACERAHEVMRRKKKQGEFVFMDVSKAFFSPAKSNGSVRK